MKKSVIISIGIVYIIAILVVGLFGQKIHVYDPTVYATSIECKSENYVEYSPEEKAKRNADGGITVQFVKGMRIDLKCQVVPNNTTNQDLDYNYERDKYDETKVLFKENADHTASFTFFENPRLFIVQVKSGDSRAELIIRINLLDF